MFFLTMLFIVMGIVQGAHWSWKVMKWRTIFQGWKVMENGKGHGKSWEVLKNDDNVMEFLQVHGEILFL